MSGALDQLVRARVSVPSSIDFGSAVGTPIVLDRDTARAYILSTGDVVSEITPANIVSVKDPQFGAKGDGVTDDTAAINSARTAALGKTLYFPKGTYLVSSAITITSSEHWVFEGNIGNSVAGTPGAYLIKKSTLNADLITITGYGTVIEGGGILGQVGNGGNGFTIQANSVKLLNPWVVLMGQDGISIGGGANQNSFKIVQPVCTSNVRHGIYVSDAGINANAGTIDSPFCQSNGGDGIKLDVAQKNTILNATCETNTGIGLHIAANAQLNAVFGGDCAEANGTDLQIDNGAQGNCIFGTQFTTFTNNGQGNWIVTNSSNSVLGLGATFTGGSDPNGTLRVKSASAGTQAAALWNAGTTGVRYLVYMGTEAAFTARGALVTDTNGNIGLTEPTGANGVFITSAGRVVLLPGTADIQWGKALVALGGGAAPTLGTIGGSGPAAAAQNTWLRLLDSAGNACFVPVWK
jgi:hypothetical protein